MKSALIVSGGDTEKELLEDINTKYKFDIIIASDKGLEILDKCNIKPNYIIGDFDSIDKELLDKYIDNKKIKIMELNPVKNFTDTHMAIKLAIKLKSTKIIILGATGTRIDHVLGNINVLREALENNIECKIIDSKNEIQLINKEIEIELDEHYKYISLIPLTTNVKGVDLRGFKYSLSNANLNIGYSLGISNEQIDKLARIDLKEGILILIKSKD